VDRYGEGIWRPDTGTEGSSPDIGVIRKSFFSRLQSKLSHHERDGDLPSARSEQMTRGIGVIRCRDPADRRGSVSDIPLVYRAAGGVRPIWLGHVAAHLRSTLLRT
jgi:hypothetical protein